MNAKTTDYLKKIADLAITFPWVLLVSLSAAVINICLINEPQLEGNSYLFTKLLIVACLGISVFFALKLTVQNSKFHPSIQLLGWLILAGVYFLLPNREKDFTEVYADYLVPFFIISHLLVSISTTFSATEETQFWQFNKNLFVNTILSLLFTFVLIGGSLLAILAIDKLFNLDIKSDLYLKIFYFLLIFGSTVIFLLFCNKGLSTLNQASEYPKTLKFFTQFVLVPLLFVYVIILYLYTGKIILEWHLPYGWVSYLVLAYALIGILALLLVHPLKEKNTKSWVMIFSKVFFFTLIPLVMLLFLAIYTRINTYGITEPRYFVFALAIWLLVVIIYFIWSKKDKIQFIPLSLIIFCLFSLFTPYFNAFSMSKRSQKAHLESRLIKLNILKVGKINFNKTINHTDANDVSDKITFLMLRNETQFIKHIVKPNDFISMVHSDDNTRSYLYQSNVMKLFTHVEYKNQYENNFQAKELIAANSFQKISENIYLARTIDFVPNGLKLGNDIFMLKNDPSKQLEISLGTGEKLDFIPLIKEKMKRYPKASTTLPEVSLDGNIKNYHIQMIFERISIYQENKKEENYFWGDPIIIIQKK